MRCEYEMCPKLSYIKNSLESYIVERLMVNIDEEYQTIFGVSINSWKCSTISKHTSLKRDLSEECGLKLWKPLKVLVQLRYNLNVSWNFIKSLVIKERNIELVIHGFYFVDSVYSSTWESKRKYGFEREDTNICFNISPTF